MNLRKLGLRVPVRKPPPERIMVRANEEDPEFWCWRGEIILMPRADSFLVELEHGPRFSVPISLKGWEQCSAVRTRRVYGIVKQGPILVALLLPRRDEDIIATKEEFLPEGQTLRGVMT